ncbi:unnamed protein product (macronuclear) [Paramecium tetraurelia]|uniref:AP180 N-terminal homology (ANTH) domain-containing protein n=1 Tax=Paramecium tetraurelia TaxID=5888 RepID=A0DSA5_PARTE|nr:uncharacterized protein GSPATT00019626001 [Paramecium tetraurelia]CAK85922.1 unnamed protein product [Paramecium tetraurelia]|eukprot:XP_001453319.1 hypothetical protein (macronuclear) [Paramecium tetraurelia strain d4-2]
MFIKNFFKKQCRFERKLFESSIFDNQETVDLEDVKQMLQGFPCLSEIDQLVQSMTIVQVCREFLRLIPQTLDNHKKLKVLLTMHVLMGDVKHGRLFVQQLNYFNGWASTNKEDILNKFIGIQTMIIHKLSSIQEISNRSKLKVSIEAFFKDIDTSVIQFYKAINCLNFILAQYDLFLSISKLHNRTVVMEIYLLIWNDLIAMYLMLERFIRQFMECYTQLDQKQALQVYELFNEYNKLTASVRQFGSISNNFKNCNISQPKWYVPTKKEQDELQLYFQNVKIYLTSRTKRQKIEKSASQVLRVCQSTDRNYRKSTSFVGQKGDNFLQNTTLGYMKKISTATNPIAFQYTFESESKTEIQQK